MGNPVPVAPSLEPVLDAVLTPCEDEAPNGRRCRWRRRRRFGAEGPIIATGGALGAVIGQLFHITADERKTLLAVGAAAGMAATFGTPVAAVLLAVEKRPAVVIYDDTSAREAADHMVHARAGRLPVVSRANPRRVIGIVSRSDLLEAHERRLHGRHRVERTIDLAATLAWVRPNER
jgi:CBS domain-containing protein